MAAAAISDSALTFSTRDDLKIVKSELSGNDTLKGGAQNDYFIGYDGNDKITGGGGSDTLYGGKGSDTFVFKRLGDSTAQFYDGISDFSRKDHDHIDLSGVDANGREAGNGKFHFISDHDFSGKVGELQAVFYKGNTAILGDVNGDSNADFVLALAGKVHLSQSDFDL